MEFLGFILVSRYAELYLGDKINPNLTKVGGLVCSYSLNIKIELIVVNLHLKDAFPKRGGRSGFKCRNFLT